MLAETNRITPEKAQEVLGIEKSQYYARLKKLGIKAHRENGKAYLDEEQMQKLREFNEPQSAIATIEPEDISLETIAVDEEPQISEDERDDLIRSAQELKAEQLIAPSLVKMFLANNMTFDDLAPDLKEKVQRVAQAANPATGAEIAKKTAANILQEFRSQPK